MSGERAARVLVVDDDRVFRLATAELLRQEGYEVVVAADAQAAVELLRDSSVDLMLLDLRMPGTDGLGVVEALRRWGDSVPILMVSGFGTVDTAVQALHLGADDFLTKPVEPGVLGERVAELLARRPGDGRADRHASFGIVGRSAEMQAVFAEIERVAPTDATVLITGETGTGKELVARAIHNASPRRAGPFVAVDCAALAEGVVESELFGHVRGAFTGALHDRAGLIESAAGGTLFLDEIGEIGSALQLRLLRALQEREVRRVGEVHARAFDVRVVAATRRSLRDEIEAGRFREDLFYRLNVFPIALPPLRERRGDLPLLVQTALDRVRARDAERGRPHLSPFAMRLVHAYAWPGNVRELFAAIESAAIRADGERIEAQHLPPEVRRPDDEDGESARRYRSDEAGDERAAIEAALDEAGGSRSRAAELLGMGRTTLWRKMRRHGLDEPG
jgi:two-component system, NtrC family, response regulator HydG